MTTPPTTVEAVATRLRAGVSFLEAARLEGIDKPAGWYCDLPPADAAEIEAAGRDGLDVVLAAQEAAINARHAEEARRTSGEVRARRLHAATLPATALGVTPPGAER